jgi:hypothetical protein
MGVDCRRLPAKGHATGCPILSRTLRRVGTLTFGDRIRELARPQPGGILTLPFGFAKGHGFSRADRVLAACLPASAGQGF